MVTAIILLVCVYPFVLLMYFLIKNESVPKKGLYYGVSLTKEQAGTLEVEQVTKEYNGQMRKSLAVLLVVPLPAIFIPWFSVFLTFWMVWLVAGIFAFFIPFARANGKLKELKREKGWKKAEEGERIAEIKNAGGVHRVKWYHFVPQSAISVAAFIWVLIRFHGEKMEALSITMGSFAFITLLFWLAAAWMDGQKTQVISTNSEVNLNYARAKKNLWKNLWVICAWINTAYTVALLWMLDVEMKLTGFFMAATLIYTVAVLAVFFWVLKKKQKLDAMYQERMDMVQPDDDDNWLWGIVYYNPKDKRSSIEKRIGIGITTNMARPAGKALVGFLGVTLLGMLLLCIWVILLEFTPIQLSVEDNMLMASQIGEDYSVPVSIIREVTLLEDLPDWDKVSGTGMEKLQKGTFRIAEVGRCEVFLNPENTVFIRFEAAGTTYYMSGYDDTETMAVYEELVK